MIWRLIKVFILLAILAAIALIAYAYAGPYVFPADFEPPSAQTRVPVSLETQD